MCDAFPVHNHEDATRTKPTNHHAQVLGLEQQNSYLPVPIHRLPVETLAEIFLLSKGCYAHSLLRLMSVCRSWRAIVLGIPNVWTNVRLSTWTELDKVRFLLQRTRASLLNVEIDTAMDGHEVRSEARRFSALKVAAMGADKWRTLTITSFPSMLDIEAHLTPGTQSFTFGGRMDALESFRIKNPCENSIAFKRLLDVVSSSSHSKLRDMEIMCLNAIYHFSQPKFASIFRRLVTFKVGARNMHFEADILPYFERLETLEAHKLRLPSYPPDRDLSVVQTLKRIKLKAVSIEWMMGRVFPMVVECSITWPRQLEAFRKGVSLPACTSFTYKGRKPYLLSNANLPQLTSLVVGNSVWNPKRGSEELVAPPVERIESFGRQWTRLKTFHLDTLCRSKSMIAILSLLPVLEELILSITRPNALGRKFLTALMASKSESPDGTTWTASLCPNLLTLNLRYKRRIRQSETDIIPCILPCIIDSRKRTNTPLCIWISMGDGACVGMCEDACGGGGINGSGPQTFPSIGWDSRGSRYLKSTSYHLRPD